MKRFHFIALFASTLLAACGSGSSSPPAAVTEVVPASASATVDGYVGYLKLLVVAMADTREPVDVSQVMPPTTDTAEPSKVD